MAMQRMFDGLREQDVDPIIYCPRLAQDGLEDPLVRSGYRVERFKAFVPVLGLSRARRRQLVAVGGNLMSFDLFTSLRREKSFDVVHTHTLGRLGGIALTAAKKRRVPFVVTIHGGVHDLPENVKRSFNAPAGSGWEWGKFFGVLFQSHRLFVDAQAIITCNENEAALLRQEHPGKRIVVQRHGVPVELYQRDHRNAARQAFPFIRGRQVVLALGRVDPIKNQLWLVEQASAIFREHPGTVIVLAGACTDEPYGEKLQRRIVELGLEDRILLTDGLPPNDPRLIGLLQEAAILVLPSLSETFGLVLLEAWAAGTPVLASNTSGAKALIRHGENGWLFALDQPSGFYEALHRALTDPERARQTAAQGAELVSKEYSIAGLAAQLKRLYEDVVEEMRCAM